MSEPDSPRWLSKVSDELHADVPVRPAWRARLLDDIANAPKPSVTDAVDVRFDEPWNDADVAEKRRRRSIVLSPLGGLAAAVALIVVGSGITYAVLGGRVATVDRITAAADRTSAEVPAVTDVRGVREPVRFELAAPSASRVMLVGSFNEWNPVATPLVRDPATGTWTVSIKLAPGRHVYAFVVDGDVTPDPLAPRAADADFGTPNSVVFVEPPRT